MSILKYVGKAAGLADMIAPGLGSVASMGIGMLDGALSDNGKDTGANQVKKAHQAMVADKGRSAVQYPYAPQDAGQFPTPLSNNEVDYQQERINQVNPPYTPNASNGVLQSQANVGSGVLDPSKAALSMLNKTPWGTSYNQNDTLTNPAPPPMATTAQGPIKPDSEVGDNTYAGEDKNKMTETNDDNAGLLGKLFNRTGQLGEIGAIGQLLYGMNDKAQETEKRIVDPYTQQMQSEALRAQGAANTAGNNITASAVAGANAQGQKNADMMLGNALASGGDINNAALSAGNQNAVNSQLANSFANAQAQGSQVAQQGNWQKAQMSGAAADQTMYKDKMDIQEDPNNMLYAMMGALPNITRAGQSYNRQTTSMTDYKADANNPLAQQDFDVVNTDSRFANKKSLPFGRNVKFNNMRR